MMLCSDRIDMHKRATIALSAELGHALLGEAHATLHIRVNRPVLAHMRIGTRPVPVSLLADQNLACMHCLTAEALDAATLGDTVSAVTGGATGLFMSHSGGILRIFPFQAREKACRMTVRR